MFANIRVLSLLTLLFTLGTFAQAQAPASKIDDPLKLLQYRLVGPFRGGRVTAVAGVPSQPNVYYFGATGGGVWKTTDGGINWEPITDKYFEDGLGRCN